MSRDAEVGSVRFTMHGRRHLAVLRRDRSWSIEPPLAPDVAQFIAPHLDALSAAYRGPEDGFFGPAAVRQAAAYLHGTWDLVPTKPDPPGTVY